jgi:hypothetical protein
MNQRILAILNVVLLTYFSTVYVLAQSQAKDGSKIIFADNFAKDTVGTFPPNWISNGEGEITTYKDYPGKWFKMHAEGTYLPVLKRSLSSNFILTFDFIFQTVGNNSHTTEITLFNKPASSNFDSMFPGDKGICIHLEDYIASYLCYNNQNPPLKVSGENRTSILQENKKASVEIRVEQQIRVIVNGTEFLNFPKPFAADDNFNTLRFHMWGSQAEPLISNVEVKTL